MTQPQNLIKFTVKPPRGGYFFSSFQTITEEVIQMEGQINLSEVRKLGVSLQNLFEETEIPLEGLQEVRQRFKPYQRIIGKENIEIIKAKRSAQEVTSLLKNCRLQLKQEQRNIRKSIQQTHRCHPKKSQKKYNCEQLIIATNQISKFLTENSQ